MPHVRVSMVCLCGIVLLDYCLGSTGKNTKTKNVVLSSIAPCIRSHCQGEQSADFVQVWGKNMEEKDFPCTKSLESMESFLAGKGRRGNLGAI